MTPERPDELRERLRALGYLNAPVDRFVLGGAGDRRSTAALAASASARIGLIAGLLLGPAGSVGLLSKLPELITSATDALVIALYLAAMFGVAAAIAAFAVIMPASLIAKSASASAALPARVRRVAAAAGIVIFLASLAYLTLWWRAAVTTSSAPTPLFSAAVLGVAVAISLVLGHAVAVTALAVVARINRSSPETLTPGVPLSSWRATVGLAVVAFAGAAALLFASAPGSAAAPASPPLTVVPTGERVLVLGIDGLDLALLDRLRSASPGSLPSFSRLLAGSSAALTSDADRDPARVWTTIATGQPPERHGINALEGRQLAGVEGRLRTKSGAGALLAGATDLLRLTRPAITSGSERRIPTFWEVAARTGLRTSVIHWWATWPAAPTGEDAATVLSDRALLRLEQGGALDGEISPPALYEELRKDWAARHARAGARAAAAVTPDAAADIAALITRSAELDAMIADLAIDPRLANADLEVVYLPGLDIAQHGLLSAGTAASPSAIAARVQAVERYYAFLDGLIADLAAVSERTIVLVAQPGRIDAPGNGLLALAGRPARTGASRITAAPVSVAATVLSLLGVPIAADLSGAPLSALLSDEFRRLHPDRTVTTYGVRRVGPRPRAGKALDQEMIERMRSLGYVR
jgi:hypothetical protein